MPYYYRAAVHPRGGAGLRDAFGGVLPVPTLSRIAAWTSPRPGGAEKGRLSGVSPIVDGGYTPAPASPTAARRPCRPAEPVVPSPPAARSAAAGRARAESVRWRDGAAYGAAFGGVVLVLALSRIAGRVHPPPGRRTRQHARAAVPRWSRPARRPLPGAGRLAEPVLPFLRGVPPAARWGGGHRPPRASVTEIVGQFEVQIILRAVWCTRSPARQGALSEWRVNRPEQRRSAFTSRLMGSNPKTDWTCGPTSISQTRSGSIPHAAKEEESSGAEYVIGVLRSGACSSSPNRVIGYQSTSGSGTESPLPKRLLLLMPQSRHDVFLRGTSISSRRPNGCDLMYPLKASGFARPVI